jgi:hypothetical protein
MFSILKRKLAKNLHGSYPTKFAGSTQNPKKNIEKSNQPIKTKISQKKSMFSYLNSVEEPNRARRNLPR